MKTCVKCRVKKPLSDFYAHRCMADGHLNKCKDCTKLDVNQNRAARRQQYRQYDRARWQRPERKEQVRRSLVAQQERNPEKFRDYKRAWDVQHKDQTQAAKDDWIQRNPDKRAAHIRLGNAVRDGYVKKQPCSLCGTTERVHGHHTDYTRPLFVTWLCAKCHKSAHRMEKFNGQIF